MIINIRTFVFFLFAIAATGFIVPTCAYGQATEKEIHRREQLWLGYFNQTRLGNKWGFWAEAQYRMTDNFVNRSLLLFVRPALTYYIKDNLRVNFGYAFVQHYPARGSDITRAEHRPWQQIWWNQKHPGLVHLQWLRLEQRFLQKVSDGVKVDDYNYTFRIRYNMTFFIPLTGNELTSGTTFGILGNEVFLNFGENIVYNTFDQNRFFAGVGYQFSPQINVQAGYTNIYQQESSGINYFSTHGIRLSLFHNVDLRKKE
ncbi:MAG TPA: DUF2490 domain-containing protein [Chryseosolibacter sp.]|nr:DUF2490 domain-containing protein [Chryseosolibacter sp.]